MNKPEPKKKATITDVAKAAGVATGTVSRVFNRHADVNEEIRQRVLNAANELGYVRLRQRKATRSSSNQKQGNVGIVCFGMEDTLIQIPIISRAVQGVEHRLSGMGRNLMIANIPRGDRVPPFMIEGTGAADTESGNGLICRQCRPQQIHFPGNTLYDSGRSLLCPGGDALSADDAIIRGDQSQFDFIDGDLRVNQVVKTYNRMVGDPAWDYQGVILEIGRYVEG